MLLGYINCLTLLLSSPATGDEAKPWLWIGIGVGVIGLAIVFLMMSKRDRGDDDEE